MKGNKPQKPREYKASRSFKPSPLIVNYSHSAAYSNKPQGIKNKNHSKEEKILYIIEDFGLPLAALFISFATLGYVIVQTDISKQAMRISNRPYVGIDKVTYLESSESDIMFGRTFFIKNSGQTPAYNTSVVYKWELLSINSIHKIPKFSKKDSIANQLFIPAGDIKPFDIVETIDHPNYDDFEKGTAIFFVHGAIKYEDIFNEKHFTEFGFQCKTGIAAMKYCQDHNKADQVK